MANKFLPVFILFILTFIWGSSFILIKKGLIAFNPVEVGALRIFFAYLVAVPIALKYLRGFLKKNWRKLFIYGLFGNLVPAILFASAETSLSSSLTGILNSVTPISTLIIGALFFSTAIKSKQLIGLVISFSGSVMLSFIGSEGELGSFNYYALFVIAATLCYGYTTNLVKVDLKHINSLALTSIALFMVGPFTFFYLVFSDVPAKVINGGHPALMSLGFIFLLGAFGTTAALFLFNKLISLTTAVFAASITYLIPLTAVVWGALDGESIFVFHFIGMALVVSGVYLISKYK